MRRITNAHGYFIVSKGSVRRGGVSDSENAAIARPHFGPDDGIAGLGDSL